MVPYYALAAGFLTGKYKSKEDAAKNVSRGGKVKGYFDARGEALLSALRSVAETHNATPAQVTLAWLITRPGITAPIAGATSLDQLKDIMQTPHLALTDADIATLDQASA